MRRMRRGWQRLLATRTYPTPVKTEVKGTEIMHDPLWNKGMAFDWPERDRLNLRGLIPPRVKSEKEQVERVLRLVRSEETDIRKNLILQDLHDRNETLFHKIVLEHIGEIAPLIYTPTVGIVCQMFGVNYRRPRGMYFSRHDRGLFGTMLHNWPSDDVKVIVVTDGSRILGLGDLGAHGMGIPVGKLALYCAAGGIAPHHVLPVVLDVGTNNPDLLASEDYIGTPEKRLSGDEYYEFVDEFMQAVEARWPKCVVQFEDFETPRAVPLLAKYRDDYRCFNDDIQGTGCVTLAGLLSAARNAGTSITDIKVLCAGAGSAGLGVCAQIVDGMVEAGMSREDAMARFVVCTSQGALGKPDGSHGDPNATRGLSDDRKPWVNPLVSDGASMLEAITAFRPTCLLGLAAQPGGLFTEEMIKAMTTYAPAPIIMPMSNPTSKAECTPEQAYAWSEGTAVVATGSPFAPVTIHGKTHTPSQCNNMYVFPGIGLAAAVAPSLIPRVTDKMLYRAAVACADAMTAEERAEGRTFPDLKRIRDVSKAVACAVIEEGFRTASAHDRLQSIIPQDPAGLEAYVEFQMWKPVYHPLVDPTPRHFD
ncbi:hypothetical protein CTAYLR_008595 [Chrysophaeum taylorii]|uniref:Malic enzyme n=1 Tax=Chrysophaeum taylorii TaxID=2483200 RepID=A0AAD7UIU8_9STRA|nr:hypothetical protein CTAYLR_008595 [Chrysophaeum taylorii]